MAYLTFPSSWSAPTTCFSATDIWAVIYSRDPDDTDVVAWSDFLGVPATTPTGDCLPPSYATSVPYFGQTCPPGYRVAVASKTVIFNQEARATLCCPGTDYSFVASGTAGCQTELHEDFIATWTDPKIGEQRPTTFSTTSDVLYAFGITIISTSSSESTTLETSSSDSLAVSTNTGTSTAIGTTTATSSPSSTRLSAGAAAGIGVGAVLGAILLGLAGWIMYRRRGKTVDGPANGPAMQDNEMRHTAPEAASSPALSFPGTSPGPQSASYQAQKFGFSSSPPPVQGRPTSELPS